MKAELIEVGFWEGWREWISLCVGCMKWEMMSRKSLPASEGREVYGETALDTF